MASRNRIFFFLDHQILARIALFFGIGILDSVYAYARISVTRPGLFNGRGGAYLKQSLLKGFFLRIALLLYATGTRVFYYRVFNTISKTRAHRIAKTNFSVDFSPYATRPSRFRAIQTVHNRVSRSRYVARACNECSFGEKNDFYLKVISIPGQSLRRETLMRNANRRVREWACVPARYAYNATI